MQDGVNSDKIAVVGLPDTAVKESKDRVTSAISLTSFSFRKILLVRGCAA